MAESPRRGTERLPCDLAADLHSLSSGLKVTPLRLRDLALGGAHVESPVVLQRGLSYELRLRGGAFPARVTWEGKPDPKGKPFRCGLVFTLTREQEERLAAILDELRLKPWS